MTTTKRVLWVTLRVWNTVAKVLFRYYGILVLYFEISILKPIFRIKIITYVSHGIIVKKEKRNISQFEEISKKLYFS